MVCISAITRKETLLVFSPPSLALALALADTTDADVIILSINSSTTGRARCLDFDLEFTFMVMVFTRYVIVDVADFVRLELGLALDRQYDGGEIDDRMDLFW
jgi:protease II